MGEKSGHTMKCHELEEQLSDYIDHKLGDDVNRKIEGHLDICEDCRIILNTTQKTIELSQIETQAQLSDEFKAKLTRKLQSELVCKQQSKSK